ncbi:PAS domain S-box protein [Clostridium sp.]
MILNKPLYFIILIALYTTSFIFIYNLIGGIAGGIAIAFLFIISYKFRYIDVIVFGIMITIVNIYIRIIYFSENINLTITISNHFIIILISLSFVYLIKKERLIREQYTYIHKANLKLKQSNDTLENEITQRIRTEEALKESESQFRHSVEDSPIPAMLHADDGEVIKISKAWTDITGYTIKDIPTISKWSEMAYDFKKNILGVERSSSLNLGQRQHNGEYYVKTIDGNIIIWDFYTSCI